jgi:hypothetical protein
MRVRGLEPQAALRESPPHVEADRVLELGILIGAIDHG